MLLNVTNWRENFEPNFTTQFLSEAANNRLGYGGHHKVLGLEEGGKENVYIKIRQRASSDGATQFGGNVTDMSKKMKPYAMIAQHYHATEKKGTKKTTQKMVRGLKQPGRPNF